MTTTLATIPATVTQASSEDITWGNDVSAQLVDGQTVTLPVVTITDLSVRGQPQLGFTYGPSVTGTVISQRIPEGMLTALHNYRLVWGFTPSGTTDIRESATGVICPFGPVGSCPPAPRVGFLEAANNLSDVSNIVTAVANLGLGGVVSGVVANAAAIAAETSRAEGAESTLTTGLASEITRATGAESALRTTVSGLAATAWVANTVYPAETVVTNGAVLYQAPSGGVPSRATFTPSDWIELATIALPVGTTSGTVAAGNDSRFAGSPAGTAGASLSATDATTTNTRTPSTGSVTSATIASGGIALPSASTAATQSPLDSSTKLATTAYTDAAALVEKNRATTAEGLLLAKADNLASVADAGSSRHNIHNPVLAQAQAAVSANVNIAAPGATFDTAVTLPILGAGVDRILLFGQSTASQNGPWVWQGSAVPLIRPTDYPSGGSVQSRLITIAGGATYAGQTFRMATTTSVTIDTTATTWASQIGTSVQYGPSPSGDTSGATDTPLILAALAALPVTGGTIRLPVKTGIYYLNQVISVGIGQWIEADGASYDLQSYGVVFRYVGAATSTPFVSFGSFAAARTPGCGARFISFDCNSLAANGLQWFHGERQGYEDIEVENFTGYGVTIGDGVANNNGFSGKGSLYLRGLAGSTPLIENTSSTDDMVFDIIDITPSIGVSLAMAQCCTLQGNGALLIGSLTVTDANMTGYAISLAGGSLGIQNLVSECAQTLIATNVGRGRGSWILQGRISRANPQAGQYVFDFGASGDTTQSFLLNGLTIYQAAGGNTPNIRVNGCVLDAVGIDWKNSSGTSIPPNLTLINGGRLAGATRTTVNDANYTTLVSDLLVAFTALTAARIVTLASGASAGRSLTIKDESGACSPTNTITVGSNIDGLSTAVLSSPYAVLTLYWNGTTWNVINRTPALMLPPVLIPATITATNSTWPIPSGANYLEIVAVGGGGGGGGGGSTNASATGQAGGAGGGAGGEAVQIVAVGSNSTLNVTIGVGGTGGAGAAAGGNPGTIGNAGSNTTVTGSGISVVGTGGGQGRGSIANSATGANAGAKGAGSSGGASVSFVVGPGCGGPSGSYSGGPGTYAAAGGAGGGGSNTTNGGGGGAAGTFAGQAVTGISGAGSTSPANGVNGGTAAANRGGGGGGGGAGGGQTSNNGTGGNGGAGGSGFVVIRVIA